MYRATLTPDSISQVSTLTIIRTYKRPGIDHGLCVCRKYVELKKINSKARTVPREFADAEATANCSAGYGTGMAAAELKIRKGEKP